MHRHTVIYSFKPLVHTWIQGFDPTRKLTCCWIGSNNKTIDIATALVQYFIIPTHNLVRFILKAEPL